MIDDTIKDRIQAISDEVDAERGNPRNTDAAREYALAITKLDEAFMWLVAGQTKVGDND